MPRNNVKASPSSKFNQVEIGILAALSYASVFEYPLTIEELYRFLPVKINSLALIQLQVDSLIKMGKLETSLLNTSPEKVKVVYLKGEKQFVNYRAARANYSKARVQKTKQWLWLMNWVPWVQAIYITGSVAANNATSDDDIDLMFITDSNRLWLTRLLISISLGVFGVKRTRNKSRGKQVSNRFCTNLFLDLNSITMAQERRNIYTAHEVVQAKLVWHRQEFDPGTLLSNNLWIRDFLPNFSLPTETHNRLAKHKQSALGNWIEGLVYRLQSWYMSGHKTSEYVTKSSAFFHPRKTADIVLSLYHQKLKQVC